MWSKGVSVINREKWCVLNTYDSMENLVFFFSCVSGSGLNGSCSNEQKPNYNHNVKMTHIFPKTINNKNETSS